MTLLNKIEVFQLPDIDNKNINQVNSLLTLLSHHCPNWTSLSCGDLRSGATLTLSQLNNLTSFSCGDIHYEAPLSLSELNNLISFSCRKIYEEVGLFVLPKEFPKLQSIHFGSIHDQSVKTKFEDFKAKAQIQAQKLE